MSRNILIYLKFLKDIVAPREGCVSRNMYSIFKRVRIVVAPREGCVSRNSFMSLASLNDAGRTPRGVCE